MCESTSPIVHLKYHLKCPRKLQRPSCFITVKWLRLPFSIFVQCVQKFRKLRSKEKTAVPFFYIGTVYNRYYCTTVDFIPYIVFRCFLCRPGSGEKNLVFYHPHAHSFHFQPKSTQPCTCTDVADEISCFNPFFSSRGTRGVYYQLVAFGRS